MNSNSHYHYLEKGFGQWLGLVGYAEPTVKSWPMHVREFFAYLEARKVHHITLAQPRHINGFIRHLGQRDNKTYGGGLSSTYINKFITALNSFGSYLSQTGKHSIDLSHRELPGDTPERQVLSLSEIQALYESTFQPYEFNSMAIGQRDRAIIAVFYGCGLRRSEGVRLNIFDIDLAKSRLFVRNGKGNKQRHVPIARKHLDDIRAYITEGRQWFMENHFEGHYQHKRYGTPFTRKENVDDESFFLNLQGKRMSDFAYRLKVMRKRAGIETEFSLHHLRHSIATHLLDSGMGLENIAKFLGHGSLVSTQIYTHIVERLKRQEHE